MEEVVELACLWTGDYKVSLRIYAELDFLPTPKACSGGNTDQKGNK